MDRSNGATTAMVGQLLALANEYERQATAYRKAAQLLGSGVARPERSKVVRSRVQQAFLDMATRPIGVTTRDLMTATGCSRTYAQTIAVRCVSAGLVVESGFRAAINGRGRRSVVYVIADNEEGGDA